MQPISGINGTVKVGAVPTSLAWVGKWTFKADRKSVTVGPHMGDENEYPMPGGLSATFTIDGTIPNGGDPGQDLVIAAFLAGSNSAIELGATGGKIITFDAPVFETLEIDVDAKGSHTIKASGKGTFDIEQDA